ncbi:MAG: hypothetical protein J5693_05450 [Bacteroidales bacterium]|nr:hypothetical protein [Bacteroidales bacterium]
MKKLLLAIAAVTVLSLSAAAQGYELSIEGMGSVGPIRCSNNYYGINILNGYRFKWGNGFYVGVGSGMVGTSYLTDFRRVNYLDGRVDISRKREAGNFFVPVYGSLQYYLAKDKTRLPFVRLDVGYEFAVFRFDWDRKLFDKTNCKHGMYVEPSFGYTFKTKGPEKSRSWYVAVGPTFQRCVFNRTDVQELAEPDESGYIGTATTKTHNWLLPTIAFRAGWRL